MRQFNRILAVFLTFVMLLGFAPLASQHTFAASYDYEELGVRMLDDVVYKQPLTAAEKTECKSKAMAQVEAALIDPLEESAINRFPNRMDEFKAEADKFITAINKEEASKSFGIANLGAASLGAMKRLYLNNKPVEAVEELKANSSWMLEEIKKNDGAASLALGAMGAAFMDAGAEVNKFPEIKSDILSFVDAMSLPEISGDELKCDGIGILAQGMIGAMKRCYINNKPVTQQMRNVQVWLLDEIAKDGSEAGVPLGQIGAALEDCVGETGKPDSLDENVALVVVAFSQDGMDRSWYKSYGLGIMCQGMIGAMKRCYINNKPVPEGSIEGAVWLAEEIGKYDGYACLALGKIGAALTDAGMEVNRADELNDYMEPVVQAFATGGVGRSDTKSLGMGIFAQAMVGAMKRSFINQKPVTDDFLAAAAWITEEIGKGSATAGPAIGKMGAALMDAIGETGHAGEYCSYMAPLVEAFSAVGVKNSTEKCVGLGILQQGMVGALKRLYMNSKSVPNAMLTTANKITEEIKNSDPEAGVPLGKMGAALMDSLGELSHQNSDAITPLLTEIEPVIKAAAAAKGKSEALGGLLGQAMVGALKRQGLNNKTISTDMQQASTWLLEEIKNSSPDKSQGIAMMGLVLYTKLCEFPEAAGELMDSAEMMMDYINECDGARSTAISVVGQNLLAAITLYPSSVTEMKDSAKLMMDAIKSNEPSKCWNYVDYDKSVYGKFYPYVEYDSTNIESWGIGELGAELVKAVGQRPDLKDELDSAALKAIDAVKANPSSKSMTILKVGNNLINRITRRENMAEDFSEATDEALKVIAKNDAASVKGMSTILVKNIECLADVSPGLAATVSSQVTAYVANVESLHEKDSYAQGRRSRGSQEEKEQLTLLSQSFAGGSINLPEGNISRGDTVKLVSVPDEGYQLTSLKVKCGAEGAKVELTSMGKGEYSFAMPEENIVIEATFQPIPGVASGSWYAKAATFVIAQGIMKGTERGFEPNATASRAQIAQILMNLDGGRPSGSTVELADVKIGDWYAEAVSWMIEKGIARGQGGKFGVKDSISRQDLAVMLYNYAGYKGYDTSARGSVGSFADADLVKDYAREALDWAIGVGLMAGSRDGGKSTLNPQGNATRAQIAVIMERFCKTVAK